MGAGLAGALRAKALNSAAELAFFLDDVQQAETLSTECLALYRELGDKAGIADALMLLGTSGWARSQFGVARPQLEEAAAFYQELGDQWKRGRCLTQLARIDTAQGAYDRAQCVLEESLALYHTLGDKERIGWVLYLRARLLFLSERDTAAARRLAEQSLALSQEAENPWYRTYPLVLLGQLTLQQGEQARARELFEESLALLKEVGDRGGMADALMGLASVATLQGDFVAAHALYQESLVHYSDYKEGIAPVLEGLARVAAQQSEPEQAARLWGAAEALRKTIEAPMPPVERTAYERAVEEARRHAHEEAFASAWAEGYALPLEQVLAELLRTAK
jgi:tetratricopeptide (TPR) repeat protein